MTVIFGTHVLNDDISSKFFQFLKFWFLGLLGDKRAKNDLKLPILACFALYLRNCRSYHLDIYNDIYRSFSSYFFLKMQHWINIKIILFLLAHFNSFFNNGLFFKFINKCQKKILRCVPPSSHVCDFFITSLVVQILKTRIPSLILGGGGNYDMTYNNFTS